MNKKEYCALIEEANNVALSYACEQTEKVMIQVIDLVIKLCGPVRMKGYRNGTNPFYFIIDIKQWIGEKNIERITRECLADYNGLNGSFVEMVSKRIKRELRKK